MSHPSITVAAIGLSTLLAAAGAAVAQDHLNLSPAGAYRAELLADAATRASLLADGDNRNEAGWAKNKFFLGGGDNLLNIGGYFQFRYIQNFRDDQPGENDFTHGFQLRRTRLVFSGNVWDKHLTYQVQGDFSRSSGAFTLVDAYAKYQWDNGFSIKFGQFKLPLLREELVGDQTQLTVERSVTNSVYNQNRSQAVEAGYQDKQFRAMFDLSDGINTLNTDFNAPTEADIAATLRGEWLFAGEDFKRFDDHTSWQDSPFTGMLGAAVHYQSGGETGFTNDIDLAEATIDCSLEGDGWNAFAAAIWRNIDAGGAQTDDFGVVIQGGIFVSNQVELFGRYDALFPDIGDEFNTLTAGVNYYISPRSHAVKFTGDITYYIDDTSGTPLLPGNNTGVGLLPETDGGEVALRLQMLIMF